jgi:hypothetical protein
MASTIGPNCQSCNGGIYSLSYTGSPLPDADPLHETYRVTLTVDASGFNANPVASTYITDVAVKVSNSLFGASIVSAPTGAASWTSLGGGLNANGCSGSGSGFECALYNKGVGVAINNGPLIWIFDLTVNNGSLDLTATGASIKVRYSDAYNNKVGSLVSEDLALTPGVSTTPEPSSAALVLAGLGLGAWKLRRR